jgi:hypothetical protein
LGELLLRGLLDALQPFVGALQRGDVTLVGFDLGLLHVVDGERHEHHGDERDGHRYADDTGADEDAAAGDRDRRGRLHRQRKDVVTSTGRSPRWR